MSYLKKKLTFNKLVLRPIEGGQRRTAYVEPPPTPVPQSPTPSSASSTASSTRELLPKKKKKKMVKFKTWYRLK